MPIIVTNENIFNLNASVIINTVNCVGVMGRGLALQFKKKFPENFNFYKKMCDDKQLIIGKLCIYHHVDILTDQYIVNFPTKKDWRENSELEYIHRGMKSLMIWLEQYHHIKSVAIPALGCSNGHLAWSKVKLIIESYIIHRPDITFYLIPPKGT